MAWATIEQLDTLLGARADDFSTEQKQSALDLATLTLDAVTTCDVALEEDVLLTGWWEYHKNGPPPNNGEIRDDGSAIFIAEIDDDGVDRTADFGAVSQPYLRLTVGGVAHLFVGETASDEGTYRRLTGSWEIPPDAPPTQGERLFVEWLAIGLPIDGRFQLATSILASSILTAAPVVAGGSLVSETIGGYAYQLDDATTTTTALDVTTNPTIVSLIGFCLPQANYELNVAPTYAFDDCCVDCGHSAHGYGCGCGCVTPYRATHYPYPARRFP